MDKTYYIYIATNENHYVLYTGVTNNIQRIMFEHKQVKGSKFTFQYKINKLVYIEEYREISEAIAREKQIKAGSRKSKLKLINSLNPNWNDLSGAY